MSNRYRREVTKRALLFASEALATEGFAIAHVGHRPGSCVDCDAERVLVSLAEIGLSLHEIRRTLGGRGGERDPLRPPLLGMWSAAFPSREAAKDAQAQALQEDYGLVTPRLSDLDDPLSLERRIGIHYNEIEAVRAQIQEWAATFGGEIVHEEIRLAE